MPLGLLVASINPIGDDQPDVPPHWDVTFAVDDADAGITHVVRGDDHVSNTPKHLLLFESLGKEPPAFAHVPLILGTDKKRLSKRHGAQAGFFVRSAWRS